MSPYLPLSPLKILLDVVVWLLRKVYNRERFLSPWLHILLYIHLLSLPLMCIEGPIYLTRYHPGVCIFLLCLLVCRSQSTDFDIHHYRHGSTDIFHFLNNCWTTFVFMSMLKSEYLLLCQMSHFACHMSHVTLRMSHVISQMLMLILGTCWTTFVLMSMRKSEYL